MSYHVPPPTQIVAAGDLDGLDVPIEVDRGRSRSIDPENRVDTFSVCCPSTPNDEDCSLCCVGCVAPCCLVGSFAAMRRTGFTKKVGPCGGCGGECCGACLSAFFLNGGFTLVNGCVAMTCLRGARDDDDIIGTWLRLSFCYECETCAAYRGATNQIDNKRVV